MLIIPVIFVLLCIMVFSIIFKNADKKDKGFEIIYFKLSYRRKLIRTLTSLPSGLFAIIIIYFYSSWSMKTNVIIVIFIFLTFIAQLIYNFYMWKKIKF